LKVLLCKEPGCDEKSILKPEDISGVVGAFFIGSDPGDKLTLEIAEMTREEIDTLPEFQGC